MDNKRLNMDAVEIGCELKAMYEKAMALKQMLVRSRDTICFKVKDLKKQLSSMNNQHESSSMCFKYYPNDSLFYVTDAASGYMAQYECAVSADCISDQRSGMEMFLSGDDEILTTFAEVASAGGRGKQMLFDALAKMLISGKVSVVEQEELEETVDRENPVL